MLTRTSRAFGELLCARTNSACAFSFGEPVPWSTFCSIGMASSGALFWSALSARIFISSSVSAAGSIGLLESRFTSTSSAFASLR